MNYVNIYNQNFNANQIEFLSNTKLHKEPILMKAISLTYFFYKKPGCYNSAQQLEIKSNELFFASKSSNHAIIKIKETSFEFSIPWNDYVKIKQKNTFVPIAVFAIA